MTEKELSYTREAEKDVVSIFYDLQKNEEKLHNLFLASILELGEKINQNPDEFDVINGQIRQAKLELPLPYTVVFEIFPHDILILRVFESNT